MRLRSIATLAFGLAAAACGGAPASPVPVGVGTAEGDAGLVASAEKISDAIGGCAQSADAPVESKVVGLESGAIVMVGCSKGAYSFTHRLFIARAGAAPELLTLPDYDTSGWYGADQASMAELDAGTGVLTTTRKGSGANACGSQGRYQWDGKRFALQEMQWSDCAAKDPEGFTTIWPTQPGSAVQPGDATPAP